MPESFSTRLATLTSLQEDFARLLAATAGRQLAEAPHGPVWIQVDGPPGHGKTAVLRQLRRQIDGRGDGHVCAWVEADPGTLHRQILLALAARAPLLQRLELRARIVFAAAPSVLAQRYLPASLLVLAVLLVLSDPQSLSPWGFLLAGLVAALSVVAAWTGREAPLRLTRPALRRACRGGRERLSIVLDDLDLALPDDALRSLQHLRALTRDLPVAVYVGCDRTWLGKMLAGEAPLPPEADRPEQTRGVTETGRFFDLSITVPQRWNRLPTEEEPVSAGEEDAGLDLLSPRLLLRHRLATAVLLRIYRASGHELPADTVSRWSLLCLRWPALAEFLATYPARVAHFRYEQQPPEAPPAIAGYFTNPGVLRLLRTSGDNVALEEKTLRLLLAPFPLRRPPVA